MNDILNRKERIWTLEFCIFIFMSAVLCTGASVIIPVIPNIMREYNVSSNFITMAFVTLVIGRFISSIAIGYILLKISVQKVLLVSFILHIGTMTLLMFARNGIEFSSLRFLEGVFEGIISVALQIIVFGLSSQKDRGVKVGYMQSAFGFGFIIGPLISSLSMRYFGSKSVFGIVALLMFISIILLMFTYKKFFKNTNEKSNTQKIVFDMEFLKFLPLYGGPILQRLLMVAFSLLIPLFLVDRFHFAAHNVGYFFTISAFITTATMPFTGRLSKSKYCSHIVAMSIIIMGVTIAGMAMAKNQLIFTIFFIMETLSFSVMVPNSMKIFGDEISDHKRRSEVIGTSSSIREILNILIIFCIIPIYNRNMNYPWIMLAVICFLLSIPYIKHAYLRKIEIVNL